MTVRRLPGVVVGIAALTLGLSGCSTVVDGVAVKDPAVSADAVNTALLQTGNYPTAPLPPTPPSDRAGKIADAHRMAEHVVVGSEIDPALTRPLTLSTSPLIVPSFLNSMVREPLGDIAAAHGFVNGFATGWAEPGPNERRTDLSNMVLRFPSDQDASAVANDTHQQLNVLPDSSPPEPVAVPGHPEALATKQVLKDGRTIITSFTAHGPYVLVDEVTSPDAARAASLVAKALDLQLRAIDAFQPTPVAELATMNPDPTGLWARTLQNAEYLPVMGVYGPHGIMHLMQPEVRPVLEDAGVDAVSWAGVNKVYQTRDAAAARGLADTIAKDFAVTGKPAASVPGMPSAKCYNVSDSTGLMSRYSCVATADRWAMVVVAPRERDAAQQLSAQYLMLVGK
ncbi:hypothetical protein ABQF34_01800 [Mycolicibacterium boenickei]